MQHFNITECIYVGWVHQNIQSVNLVRLGTGWVQKKQFVKSGKIAPKKQKKPKNLFAPLPPPPLSPSLDLSFKKKTAGPGMGREGQADVARATGRSRGQRLRVAGTGAGGVPVSGSGWRGGGGAAAGGGPGGGGGTRGGRRRGGTRTKDACCMRGNGRGTPPRRMLPSQSCIRGLCLGSHKRVYGVCMCVCFL